MTKEILNKKEIDSFLFENSCRKLHKCVGVKGKDGRNIAWKDTVSGEKIDIIYKENA